MITLMVYAPLSKDITAKETTAVPQETRTRGRRVSRGRFRPRTRRTGARRRGACLVLPVLLLLPLIVATLLLCGCQRDARRLQTGLEVLAAENFRSLAGRRVGVVTNPTGVDRELRSLPGLVHAAPEVTLAAIFGPEHGVRGAAQAGEHVKSATDALSGVPVYSLYGSTRSPTAEMLAGLDTLLFDIQDIGVRTYTYLATLLEVLVAAAENDIEVWVLDRPVPTGGRIIEGPVLESRHESFVGPHPVPLRHGLTAGEFARMVNEERDIGARLTVIEMKGYSRDVSGGFPNGPWIAPSPNIPTLQTAYAYAGMVLIEGTNLSEGRGTTRPFRLIGAPWMDGERVAREMETFGLAGCRFRGAVFTPWFSKHRGNECGAVELFVTDYESFRAVTTAVALLELVHRLYPDTLEIVADRFDRLAGTSRLREDLLAGRGHRAIVADWQEDLEAYRRRREKFLIYP